LPYIFKFLDGTTVIFGMEDKMLSDKFLRIIAPALENEGVIKGKTTGYVNDAVDLGGETIYGISKRFWKKDFEVVYNLCKKGKFEEAWEYALEFYNTHFYNHFYDYINDESLRFKIFDFGINSHPQTAVRLLQQVINKHFYLGLKVDGAFGRLTVNAVNKCLSLSAESIKGLFTNLPANVRTQLDPNESLLYSLYVLEVKAWYETRSTFWHFGKGWLNRLRRIYNESLLSNGKVDWKMVISKSF
jgi:lysozyme family protein